MSAEQCRITLTETDGQWEARIEPDGPSGSGKTAGAAVTALAATHTDTGADARTNEIVEQALGALIEARQGETIERTFEAPDNANDLGTGNGGDMDPDAPLFAGDPIMSVDMGEESIDDVLYGSVETNNTETEPPNGA
ncbi:MAG: hypothetical protein BRD24_08495 [Halobacteriales archaeon SW_9_67_24]|jgi:hypothetical protein|nr:MAG: hypothetical protein BRD24_08495 [Halobacteriales archaeon SW_9_67_24]